MIAAKAEPGLGRSAAAPVEPPRGATGKDDLAIPAGKRGAPSTLTVWEDFRCPACKQFENVFRKTIHELADRGRIRVEYHLVTIIDGNMGGTGSVRAANAAACAQDAGKFRRVPRRALPEPAAGDPDDAFAKNARLIELAGKVQGLDTPAFRNCVEDGTARRLGQEVRRPPSTVPVSPAPRPCCSTGSRFTVRTARCRPTS